MTAKLLIVKHTATFLLATEHMDISNLIGERLKRIKQSTVSDHLLECNCSIDLDHLIFSGPILHTRGMGAFFYGTTSKKRAFCLLAPPKQMIFLTISNEKIFFLQNSGR